MSFSDFRDTSYFKTIDTAEKIELGSFNPSVHRQVEYMRICIFIHNISITTQSLRINVLSAYNDPVPMFSSAWSDLGDISNLSSYWIGWVRFDFSQQFMSSDLTYYLELETNNYTRTADTNYLAARLDDPLSINILSGDDAIAVGVEVYGIG